MSNTLMFGLGQLPDNYGKVYGVFHEALHYNVYGSFHDSITILVRFIYGSTIYEAHMDSRFLFTVLYTVLLRLFERECDFSRKVITILVTVHVQFCLHNCLHDSI